MPGHEFLPHGKRVAARGAARRSPHRARSARDAAERALIRVVHHYGSRPEFVLLGGLVPDLLCSASAQRHAGTTDVDVQVDLEIAAPWLREHERQRTPSAWTTGVDRRADGEFARRR